MSEVINCCGGCIYFKIETNPSSTDIVLDGFNAVRKSNNPEKVGLVKRLVVENGLTYGHTYCGELRYGRFSISPCNNPSMFVGISDIGLENL